MGRLHSITPEKKKTPKKMHRNAHKTGLYAASDWRQPCAITKNNEVSLICVKKTDGQMSKTSSAVAASKQTQKFSASRKFGEFRCLLGVSAVDLRDTPQSPPSCWLWKEHELVLRLKSLTTAFSVNQFWLTRGASSFTGISSHVVPFSFQSFHFTLLYFTAKRCSE